MSKLKPCPFCGSTDVEVAPVLKGKAANMLGEYSYAMCKGCDANGPTVFLKGTKEVIPEGIKPRYAVTPERQAAVLWNKALRA